MVPESSNEFIRRFRRIEQGIKKLLLILASQNNPLMFVEHATCPLHGKIASTQAGNGHCVPDKLLGSW